eukprot:s36_g1.t2
MVDVSSSVQQFCRDPITIPGLSEQLSEAGGMRGHRGKGTLSFLDLWINAQGRLNPRWSVDVPAASNEIF